MDSPFEQADFSSQKIEFNPLDYGVDPNDPRWQEVLDESKGDLLLFATEAQMRSAQADYRNGSITHEAYEQIINDGYGLINRRRQELGLPPRT